uniref:Growth hormone 2 n=1 Tax=Callorhinchus milii TaxID=7868 RepID=A0A4W3HQT1_CALMI
MASGLSLCSVALALVLLSMQCRRGLEAFPLLPLSDLLSNAVHRAQYMHLVAAETYTEFERQYVPEEKRNYHKSAASVSCQSESLPAPTDKGDAQQRSDTELLAYSLLLIQSWVNSVQTSRVFSTADRVYDKMRDLEEGIYALTKVLEDGGSFQAFASLKFSYDRFEGNLRSNEALMKNYGLLACFKKDMHKVETYLKVMNCKRFAESNCTV